MFHFLKKIFSFFWKFKKTLFFIIFLTVVFFVIRFPWNHLLENLAKNFQNKSPSALHTDFDRLELKIFPPGVELKNFFLKYKQKNLNLDSLRISMDLGQWLAFKKAWKVTASKEGSFLDLRFWKKEKALKEDPSSEPIKIYFIKASSYSLNLKLLNELFPNMKWSGRASAHFDYEGSIKKQENIKALLNLKAENVQISKTQLNTPLGPLNLPPVFWRKAEIALQVKDGEIIFKTLQLGSASDSFIVKMKGSSSFLFSYGRLRLNSYNFQLQMDLDKDFPSGLLDLMFANYKEDKGGFYRYKLRLTGQGNQIPDMEKLEKF